MTFTVRVPTPEVSAVHAGAAEALLSAPETVAALIEKAATKRREGDHDFKVAVHPKVDGGEPSFGARALHERLGLRGGGMELGERIEEILRSAPETRVPLRMKLRALTLLAYERRDADDSEGFEAVVAAFDRIPDPDGGRVRFTPSRGFSLMYSGRPAALILREKHGDRHFDVGSPDLFARAFLAVLKERLGEGWYRTPEPYVGGDGPTPLEQAYFTVLRGSDLLRVVAAAKPSREVMKTLRDSEEMAVLRRQCSPGTLYGLLKREIDADGGGDAAFVLLLAYAVYIANESYGPSLAALLAGDARPLVRFFVAGLPEADEDRAATILRESSDSLRRAGRLAHDFLAERRNGEYERFEVVFLDRPEFEPADGETADGG